MSGVNQIRATPANARVQSRRTRDLLLFEMIVVIARGDIEAFVREDPALVERVFVRGAKRDELVIAFAVREVEACDPPHGSQCGVARPFERLRDCRQVAPARRLVEAAYPHIDGMNLAPAQQGHQLIAGLLESKAALHHAGMGARHLDRPLEAEEVRRVRQVDVQCVAFDPFAAIEQPPQVAQRQITPFGIVTPSASSMAWTALIW